MKKIIIALALLFFFSVKAQAETLYVREDTSHSGTRNGTSYATAWGGWSEIQWGAGAGKVSGGDTLYLCGAHAYSADINVGNSGASAGNVAIIDGACPDDAGSIALSSSGTNVNSNRTYVKFQNMTLSASGTGTGLFYYYGTDAVGGGPSFENVIFTGGTYGILLTASTGYSINGFTIKDCTFQNQTSDAAIRWLATGTSTGSITNISITGSLFQNITGQAIEMRAQSENSTAILSNAVVDNNRFFNISGMAIWMIESGYGVGWSSHNWGNIKARGNTCGGVSACMLVGGNIGSTMCDTELADNTIYNTTGASGGINLISGSYACIHDNYIHDSTSTTIDGNGILVDFGNDNVDVYNNRIDNQLGGTFTITGVTKANPAVVTITGTPPSNGTMLFINRVAGMTELNGKRFYIYDGTAHTFTLKDESFNYINSTTYGTYTSGGVATRMNSGCALMVLNARHVRAWNNYGSGNVHGLYVNDVSDAAALSIQDISMFNNTFKENLMDGIFVGNGINATEIAELSFRNNITSAYATGVDSGDKGIGFQDISTGGGDATHSNNDFYNFTSTYYGLTAGSGEITTDPLLNSDYTLQPLSPSINTGATSACTLNDIVNKERLIDGKCDMGAFEHGSVLRGTWSGTFN